LRWQARRRSPNRLGIQYSADERPRPRVVGRLAALDRLHASELGRNRQARDTGAPRRSPATGLPPAGTRCPAGTRSSAGTRCRLGTRPPACTPSPAGTRSRLAVRFLAGGRFPAGARFSARARFLDFCCLRARFPATAPWPAIGQSPAGAVRPAVGLAPDYPRSPRQATTRSSMAPAPRPQATARTRSVPAPAAWLREPPLAEPGDHPQASPARTRPRKRPAGLGSSSRA
jgi:hypothetical protein